MNIINHKVTKYFLIYGANCKQLNMEEGERRRSVDFRGCHYDTHSHTHSDQL